MEMNRPNPTDDPLTTISPQMINSNSFLSYPTPHFSPLFLNNFLTKYFLIILNVYNKQKKVFFF